MEGNFMVKESQWQLHAWLRKKGYRMPAGEEKYKLPSPKEEKELDHYDKHITDKADVLKKLMKADLSQEAQKRFKTKFAVLSLVNLDSLQVTWSLTIVDT